MRRFTLRMTMLRRLATAAVCGALLAVPVKADTVEGTNGSVVQGRVVARDNNSITFEMTVGGKLVQRKFPLTLLKAITINGKREVLQGGGAAPAAAGVPQGAAPAGVQRTKAVIEAMIAQAATPPDWLASTPLNYPKTLDLQWPEKPGGPWNNQKNVGQFVWDVINANPSRWREGVRFMHHLQDLHKNNRDLQMKIAGSLGGMYHHLLLDYAHAAYWLRKAGPRQDVTALAECYWKLGSKAMAVEALGASRTLSPATIKLWAAMGETERALNTAQVLVRGGNANAGLLYAADALRLAGRHDEALVYYKKVLSLPKTDRNRRDHDRAAGAIDAIELYDKLDLTKVADGTYTDSSLGYEGQIGVAVRVAAGRIAEVKVTQQKEKQFYNALTETPDQIIQKQSVKGIDATSRATITSEAIVTATAKALRQGVK